MSFLTQSESFAISSQLSSQARDLDTSTAQLENALSKLDKKVYSKTQKKQLEELSSSTASFHLAHHQTLQKTVLELFFVFR